MKSQHSKDLRRWPGNLGPAHAVRFRSCLAALLERPGWCATTWRPCVESSLSTVPLALVAPSPILNPEGKESPCSLLHPGLGPQLTPLPRGSQGGPCCLSPSRLLPHLSPAIPSSVLPLTLFPFPVCPPPSACGLGPLPPLCGLVSTPPLPLSRLGWPDRTMVGRWGPRSSRPASSAWATTWRTTGRYAHPGPRRTVH